MTLSNGTLFNCGAAASFTFIYLTAISEKISVRTIASSTIAATAAAITRIGISALAPRISTPVAAIIVGAIAAPTTIFAVNFTFLRDLKASAQATCKGSVENLKSLITAGAIIGLILASIGPLLSLSYSGIAALSNRAISAIRV